MDQSHNRRLVVIALTLIAMALPVSAWAYGPIPPRSEFQAPPTPTPAPLPVVDNVTDTAIAEEPDVAVPGESFHWVFLPFLVSGGQTTATLTAAVQQEAQPGDELHGDPFTGSIVYTLKEGESAADLALEFGRDQNIMYCATGVDGTPASLLTAGEEIVIPALGDICHRVKADQTLAQVAVWYGVDEEKIRTVPQNNLSNRAKLRTGQYLLIPDAASRYRDPSEVNVIRRSSDNWQFGDGSFIWPIERSQTWVSQRFRHGKHMAIDLATPSGANVLASDTGTVVKAGWSTNGYGYRVVIDHGIDYVTLYAHMDEYYVQIGDIVRKGEVIGAVGSTGNSTGPHLHFEIRDDGYLIDPLLVMP